jgi:hypothetical protein
MREGPIIWAVGNSGASGAATDTHPVVNKTPPTTAVTAFGISVKEDAGSHTPDVVDGMISDDEGPSPIVTEIVVAELQVHDAPLPSLVLVNTNEQGAVAD